MSHKIKSLNHICHCQYLQVSGPKSSRARDAEKGDQDMFYSSDSELGSGAIKVTCRYLLYHLVLTVFLLPGASQGGSGQALQLPDAAQERRHQAEGARGGTRVL